MKKVFISQEKGNPLPRLIRRCGMAGVFTAAFALALFSAAAPLGAKDVTVIQADGSAVKSIEVQDVKGAAIDSALKNAVADAVETIIVNENLEVDPSLVETNIYANAVAFIVNFKILSEERLAKEVEVWPDKPAEGAGKTGAAPDIVPIVPQDPEIKAPEVVPEIKLVESYHIWIEARIDTVQLKDALGKLVLAREGTTPEISIIVLDVMDFETFKTIRDSLKRVTMIKELEYDSFYPGRVVFKARTSSRAPALIGRIGKEAGEDFIVAQGGSGSIIIKAFPKTMTFD